LTSFRARAREEVGSKSSAPRGEKSTSTKGRRERSPVALWWPTQDAATERLYAELAKVLGQKAGGAQFYELDEVRFSLADVLLREHRGRLMPKGKAAAFWASLTRLDWRREDGFDRPLESVLAEVERKAPEVAEAPPNRRETAREEAKRLKAEGDPRYFGQILAAVKRRRGE